MRALRLSSVVGIVVCLGLLAPPTRAGSEMVEKKRASRSRDEAEHREGERNREQEHGGRNGHDGRNDDRHDHYRQLLITSVFADTGAELLTIFGRSFGERRAPRVKLAGVELVVESFGPYEILAKLPPGIAPGSYLLEVARGRGEKKHDSFDVTLEAQLEGPPGPPGPIGPRGPEGPPGPPGGLATLSELAGVPCVVGSSDGIVVVTVEPDGPVGLFCDASGGGGPPMPSPAIWSVARGTSGLERGRAVAVDEAGDVLVVGVSTAMSLLDLGGGVLGGNDGNADLFIAKLSGSDGSHIWSRAFGGVNLDDGTDIAVAGGEVVVIGFFDTEIDLGGGTLVSPGPDKDVFVAKLSGGDGSHIWSTQFAEVPRGSILSTRQVRGELADDGSVWVLGNFDNAIDLGSGPITSTGGTDIFLLELAGGDGSPMWSQAFGGSADDFGADLAVDSAGNVVITGNFLSPGLSFGGPTLQLDPQRMFPDLFLAKLGTNGAHIWSKRIGGAGTDQGTAVAVDPNDRVILTGNFQTVVDVDVSGNNAGGGGVLTNSGGPGDIFLAVYTAAGAYLYSQAFAGPNALEKAWDVTTSAASGNIFLTGSFEAAIDLGGGIISTAGADDVFVAEFSANGAFVGAEQIGGPEQDQGWSVGVGADSPVVTGFFRGTTTVGPPLTSSGGDDFLVAKYQLN